MNQELANVIKIYSTGTHKELSNCLIGKSKDTLINFFFLDKKNYFVLGCPYKFIRTKIWLKQKQFQIYYQKENVKSG